MFGYGYLYTSVFRKPLPHHQWYWYGVGFVVRHVNPLSHFYDPVPATVDYTSN